MGRPNKPDHPWKKAFSAKKAAQDKKSKAYLAKNSIDISGYASKMQTGYSK